MLGIAKTPAAHEVTVRSKMDGASTSQPRARLLQPQGFQNDTVESTTRLEDLACALIPTFAAAQAQAKVQGRVLFYPQ